MAMKKIVCIGNPTESTALRSLQIASAYNMPCQGLATSAAAGPGLWYTDLGSISFEQLLSLGESADQLIMLDQPVDSYEHVDTYNQTISICLWLNRFTQVIFENQQPDLYVTRSYVPFNQFNTEVFLVNSTKEILICLQSQRTIGRRVFVELTQIDDLNEFDLILDQILDFNTVADLIIFRAGVHEPADIYQAVTKRLANIEEFVMFTPGVFNDRFRENIQSILENHWQWLYGPRRPEHYHTVYKQL